MNKQMVYSDVFGVGVKNKVPTYYTFSGGNIFLTESEIAQLKELPNNADTIYAAMLLDILNYGSRREDRTSVGTISVFGYQLRFNLLLGFPLLATKKLHFKSIAGELLWFLSGCKGGIQGLKDDYGVTIWDEWLELEKQGKQLPYTNMVRWGKDEDAINQLKNVIEEIKTNPNSRRMLVLNWNPKQVHHYKNLVLPACHYAFQFYVDNNRLSCMVNIRSNDIFIGNPYNIASYALLTQMVAHECGLFVGDLVISIGDAHIYNNHIEQVKTQLMRMPKPLAPPPHVNLNPEVKSIFDFTMKDIELVNYNPYPAIKADVAF